MDSAIELSVRRLLQRTENMDSAIELSVRRLIQRTENMDSAIELSVRGLFQASFGGRIPVEMLSSEGFSISCCLMTETLQSKKLCPELGPRRDTRICITY